MFWGAVKIFSAVMLFHWMSTEMNILIDRHLKHTPRLVSHCTSASAAVLLKLDFEASLDLHIEEQLHRICRCFRSFSFRHCILRHPYTEFYHDIIWASWHRCKASSLFWATVFLTAKNAPVAVLNVARAFLAFFNMFLCVWYCVCIWRAHQTWNHESGCHRDLE